MKYIDKHWKILKKSFKADFVALKLALLDIGFLLTLVLSYTLIYFLFVRSYLSISNILDIANGGKIPPSMSGMNMTVLWNTFVADVIIIIVLAVLLYVLILSVYGTISHLCLTNNKFKMNILINFIYIYALFTLVYLLLMVLVFVVSKNIMTAAWITLIMTLVYAYIMLVFYLVIKDDHLYKILKHGFKSMIRIHDTIVPIVLSMIMLSVLSIIFTLLFSQFILLLGILLYISTIAVMIWLRRYMHELIHT